ncbi:MAG: PCI domain-containing protein, partial [Bacteroidota bacterium]
VVFDAKKWEVDGKTVLEVVVPKHEQEPCFAKSKEGRWLAFIRKKDQNLMANGILIKVWKMKGLEKGVFIKYTEKEKLLLSFLEKNRSITISKFCRLAKISKQTAEKILIDMILLDMVEMEITELGTSYKLKNQDN